ADEAIRTPSPAAPADEAIRTPSPAAPEAPATAPTPPARQPQPQAQAQAQPASREPLVARAMPPVTAPATESGAPAESAAEPAGAYAMPLPTPPAAGVDATTHAQAPRRERPQAPPSEPPAWLLAARRCLFEGNLVAKIGLLILFIGVSFLLKYAAARVTVPIELRLAGIVLVDLAALAWAWRIRNSNAAVSLPLQGTCMAVLMLVSFGAFRLYHLIPGGMTFALLFLLTLGTCMLAVLQNAQWLAIFGIAGGFAAPILASTGSGSHIALFSYYALLNAGVFAIALKRSWRALNLLGFAFTFAIGTAWGVLRYQPENYQSAQAFLILFFLYYVGIAVAYARLQAPQLKNYVDGTLVFGTPMLAASLQFPLVKGMAFGMAFSALALGLFYGALAMVLARRRAVFGMLVDAFIALAVVFGTLAIPFALDGRWTSAAWALEGAGIVWIGLRQRQPLAWGFGLLVQLGAWVSFIGSVSGIDKEAALHSNLWLGFLLLAASAFLMATRFRAQRSDGPNALGLLGTIFLAGAAVWLVGGFWTEILLRTQGNAQANLLVASALVSAMLLAFIARRMAWALAGWLAMAVELLAGAVLLALMLQQWALAPVSTDLFATPFLGGLMILAGGAFTAWAMFRHGDAPQQKLSHVILGWSMLWWLAMVAPTLSNWLLAHYENWSGMAARAELQWPAYCLLIAATTPLWLSLARRLTWPALRWTALPAWALFALTSVGMLAMLHFTGMPSREFWLAFAALWLLSEWLMRVWSPIRDVQMRILHTLRSAGPWLMIWPVAAYWIARGLQGSHADPSWARFLPLWLMMGVLAWTMHRVRTDAWPVRPVAQWYRTVLLPLGCAWSLLLVAAWNLSQDGAMAPLPYIPLANPLDLTSIFAMLLAIGCYRQLQNELTHARQPLFIAAALAAYAWFNLALLRTVSHYLDVPYEFERLFASQFVQAMFSLVWSVTALILMRYAARKQERNIWLAGAVLLGVVVLKLFLVDLSNVGGVERIVSFLGVGALMVGIGYIAPYPSGKGGQAQQEAA
ncbi:DUF2339 domain-containing protein, partial [Pseudoduganella sp. RAF53_2]|uniref:DUF2339 domain-containing protein n=1 Tax=Pseudoduganella sp. RAF53_2 TaxID=3233060 RepID=UPI003F978B05